MEIICNIINVFTATFDQMRASLFKIKKNLTPNIWPVDYVYQLLHDNLVCGSSNQNKHRTTLSILQYNCIHLFL